MLIERFEYQATGSGWTLQPTDFFPDLTLLVGVSGVGKTQILKSIRRVKQLASTKSPRDGWGDRWSITFQIDGRRYTWQCQYESRPEAEDGADMVDGLADEDGEMMPGAIDQRLRPKITHELLTEADTPLIERDSAGINFVGKPTPKLSPYEPAISLLSQEDRIKPVYEGLGRIVFLDQTAPQAGEMVVRLGDACRRFSSLDKVQARYRP
jgi:hypothetical protein